MPVGEIKYKYDAAKGCMMGSDGFPMLNQAQRAAEPCAPMLQFDVPDHKFGDRIINGRAGQRELRARDGYVPYERVGKHVRKMPRHNWVDKNDDHWNQWHKETKEAAAAGAGLTVDQAEAEAKARKEIGSLRQKIKDREAGKQAPQINPEITKVVAESKVAKGDRNGAWDRGMKKHKLRKTLGMGSMND